MFHKYSSHYDYLYFSYCYFCYYRYNYYYNASYFYHYDYTTLHVLKLLVLKMKLLTSWKVCVRVPKMKVLASRKLKLD